MISYYNVTIVLWSPPKAFHFQIIHICSTSVLSRDTRNNSIATRLQFRTTCLSAGLDVRTVKEVKVLMQ